MQRLTTAEKHKIYYMNDNISSIAGYAAMVIANHGWARLANAKDKYGSSVQNANSPDAASFDLSTAVKKAIAYYMNPKSFDYKARAKEFYLLLDDAIINVAPSAQLMPKSLTTVDAFNDHPSVRVHHIMNLLLSISADFKKYKGIKDE